MRTSDMYRKCIEAVRIFDSNEFAALIIPLSQQPDHVLIEATFTRYDGFIGCCKPADYATKYAKQLRSLLPDLTMEITKDVKPQRVARVKAPVASAEVNEVAKPEPGLTNDDVVKLATAGLDDEVGRGQGQERGTIIWPTRRKGAANPRPVRLIARQIRRGERDVKIRLRS